MLDQTGSPPFWPFSTILLVVRLSSDQLQLLRMSSQQDGDINYLGIYDFITRCDRGVASKFDYTPSKHKVLYLGHIWFNRVQTRHPAWWHLHRNHDLKSQCHLLATGSDMFYSLMNFSWLLYNIQLKRAQSSHRTMVRIVTFPQTDCETDISSIWFATKQEVLCKSTLHYPTGP